MLRLIPLGLGLYFRLFFITVAVVFLYLYSYFVIEKYIIVISFVRNKVLLTLLTYLLTYLLSKFSVYCRCLSV